MLWLSLEFQSFSGQPQKKTCVGSSVHYKSIKKVTYFQFGNHISFSIIRSRGLIHQSLCEHSWIELLEYIFILNVFEDYHLKKTFSLWTSITRKLCFSQFHLGKLKQCVMCFRQNDISKKLCLHAWWRGTSRHVLLNMLKNDDKHWWTQKILQLNLKCLPVQLLQDFSN